MKKAIDLFNKAINSYVYIYFIGLIVVLTWATKLEIVGCVVLILISCLVVLTQKNTAAFLPALLMSFFAISLTQAPTTFMTHPGFINEGSPLFYPIVGSAFGVLILCFIYHYIKFPPKKYFLKSPLFTPWIFCIFAVLIAGAFTSNFSFSNNIAIVALFVLMLFASFVIITTKRENLKEYICHIIVCIGLIMAAETFIYYVRVPDFVQSILSKSLYVGWGLSNNISAVVAMCIPVSLYMFAKKSNVLYFICFILFLLTAVFSLSRAIILVLAIVSPVLVFLTLKYAKNRKLSIICVSSFFAIIISLCIIFFADIQALFDNLIDLGLSNNGRDTMWGIGVEMFKKFPLFGGGFYDANNIMLMSHCSIIQILGCTGIFGLIVFAYNYYQKYKILFLYKTDFSLFTLVTVAIFVFFALEDIAFFYIYLNFIIISLLFCCTTEYTALIENKTIIKKEFTPTKKKAILNGICLAVGIGLVVFASLLAVNSIYLKEGSSIYRLNDLEFVVIVAMFITSNIAVFMPLDYFYAYLKGKIQGNMLLK